MNELSSEWSWKRRQIREAWRSGFWLGCLVGIVVAALWVVGVVLVLEWSTTIDNCRWVPSVARAMEGKQ